MSNTILIIGVVGGLVLMLLPYFLKRWQSKPTDDIDPADVIVPTPIAPIADDRVQLLGCLMCVRDRLSSDAKCTAAIDTVIIPALLASRGGGK